MRKTYFIILAVMLILLKFHPAISQTADHIVISEIQIGGATSKDEFVELFNPTGSSINVNGWKLTKKTSSGSESNLLTTFPDVSIPAFTFYLIAHPDYDGDVTPNANYSSSSYSIAANNTVVLYSDANKTNIVDKVGMGDASDYEGASTVNPPDDESIERHASMLASGMNGPAQDTDNNSNDFFLQTTPNPQNMDNSLPVELSSFTASYSNNAVVLRWTTESELNNAGFFVLRADYEKGPFSEVSSFVTGAGTSTEKHNYSYNDERIETDKTYWYQLKQINTDGTFQVYGPKKINVPQLNGNKQGALPTQSQLVGNYPNPFNPGTTISLTVGGEDETATTVAIYDLLGHRVRTIIDQSMQPGFYELLWDGRNDFGLNVPSGAYFCKMFSAGGGVSMLKLLKMN